MPYGSTKVSWTKTRGEIEGKLLELKDKGVLKKHAWVTEGDIEALYMEIAIQVSDTQIKHVTLRFMPMMIFVEKKKGNRTLPPELNRNVSWRLFWWHFKARIEAVLYGLETFEEMFMSNITYQLPGGRGEVTLGEAIPTILEQDSLGKLLLEEKRDR
jgi:hypothetical protein